MQKSPNSPIIPQTSHPPLRPAVLPPPPQPLRLSTSATAPVPSSPLVRRCTDSFVSARTPLHQFLRLEPYGRLASTIPSPAPRQIREPHSSATSSSCTPHHCTRNLDCQRHHRDPLPYPPPSTALLELKNLGPILCGSIFVVVSTFSIIYWLWLMILFVVVYWFWLMFSLSI